MSAGLEKLVGSRLVGKDGEKATSAVDADYVAIYFSAHWCPPCRGFTPALAKWYQANAENKKLEIIFASSDKDQAAFDDYRNEMPWLAIPYEERSIKDKLSKKFGVQGIPTLVVLDKEGNLITNKGRDGVMSDATAENFPWKPKTFGEIMDGATVVLKDGNTVPARQALEGKSKVGIYFSAHWCPPCRAFTPTLASWYKDHAPRDDVEVFFVSADRDADAFKSYHDEMPWPAFTFGGASKDELMGRYEVEGFPTFIILDSTTGEVLIEDGRSRVEGDPTGYPWPPKAVEELSVGLGSINDGPLALLLLDQAGDDAAKQVAAYEAFETVAGEYFAASQKKGALCGVAANECTDDDGKSKDEDETPALKFAVARPGDSSADRLRQFFGLDSDASGSLRILVTDIPEGRKFVYAGDKVPDAAQLRAFLDQVKGGEGSTDLRASTKAAAL